LFNFIYLIKSYFLFFLIGANKLRLVLYYSINYKNYNGIIIKEKGNNQILNEDKLEEKEDNIIKSEIN
jgi:hypothetical protein